MHVSGAGAGRREGGGGTYEYVPGAGDDEESWARGLTPQLLWAHKEVCLHPSYLADIFTPENFDLPVKMVGCCLCHPMSTKETDCPGQRAALPCTSRPAQNSHC